MNATDPDSDLAVSPQVLPGSVRSDGSFDNFTLSWEIDRTKFLDSVIVLYDVNVSLINGSVIYTKVYTVIYSKRRHSQEWYSD